MPPRGQPAMSFGVPPFPAGVKWIAIVTLGASILSKLVPLVAAAGVLTPELFLRGWVWQAVTYPFVIPSASALLWSLLGLWLLGGALEQRWGRRRFVGFYAGVSAIAGVATALLGLVHPGIRGSSYFGNMPAMAGLIAAFAISMPSSQVFLAFILPISGRMLLAVSVGITLLFMIMDPPWTRYIPELFGFPAGALWLNARGPRDLWLRARVWWIDRRLRRSKLRVVRGKDDPAGPFQGSRGSDKYLH